MIAINNSFFNFSQYTIMISGPTWFFKGRDNNFWVISCHLYLKKISEEMKVVQYYKYS